MKYAPCGSEKRRVPVVMIKMAITRISASVCAGNVEYDIHDHILEVST